MIEQRHIHIEGIVQGVGFRPFVYRCAAEHGIRGTVCNTADGVIIEAEAEAAELEAFCEALKLNLPPLSRVDSFRVSEGEAGGFEDFRIIESSGDADKRSAVSPDIAVCDNCLAEMRDPSDRRHGYFFTNCTDCGPRYTIMRSLPYDRENTSMDVFEMCGECEAQYRDPFDRRYHAQPVSCHRCGPTLTLYDADENALCENGGAVAEAAVQIKAGKIVAIKGMGGFHLVCDATNEKAVTQLRRRKRRLRKPFAVMVPSLDGFENLTAHEKELLRSKEKPIVLVERPPSAALCEAVAPGIGRLGLFLPYTPLHHLLFDSLVNPLVVTSANLSDEPIITDKATLFEKLGSVFDAVLDYDRVILNPCDDSVVQSVEGKMQMLRRARGFAPTMVPLPFTVKQCTLAVGAHQKSTVAFAFGKQLLLSPHIGDLNSLEAVGYFANTVQRFERFYDLELEQIVCDRHGGYESTKWAQLSGKPLLQVQHHYAHILAVTAEYGLSEKVLGFAFDGTGAGDEQTVWGMEVLLCDPNGYERVGHMRPFRLLGGEKAVREPRRSALSLLFECFGLGEVLSLDSPTVRSFSAADIGTLHKAWEKGLNAPYVSSAGRLFDAVASLLGVSQISDYEGESGLLLSTIADPLCDEAFAFGVENGVIDIRPMVREILGMDDAHKAAAMFVNTLVEVIMAIAAEYPGLPLLFSGGVFQNPTLLAKLMRRCEAQQRRYYTPLRFPPNDAAIALGQAWYAIHGTMSANDNGG